MTNLDTFMEVYERKLKDCVVEFPDQYTWPVSMVPTVAEKMRKALIAGTANINSLSFKRTCKELGIKHNNKAIKEYINQ